MALQSYRHRNENAGRAAGRWPPACCLCACGCVHSQLCGSVRNYLEWSAPQDSRWPPIAPSSGPQLNMRGQDKHTLPLHPKAGAFTA